MKCNVDVGSMLPSLMITLGIGSTVLAKRAVMPMRFSVADKLEPHEILTPAVAGIAREDML
ncbi:MAG: hypothetical protein ABSB35_31480 [Bryobacteraceae bacterium]|jgi:hypothetical protein